MTADHREDVDKAVAWFSARGLVASARGRNALFVGKPADYLEDGTPVLEPTLFLEAEDDAWCLRRHRFGGGIDDGPCAGFESALELGARPIGAAQARPRGLLPAQETGIVSQTGRLTHPVLLTTGEDQHQEATAVPARDGQRFDSSEVRWSLTGLTCLRSGWG
jgi:hypothetical protein